jgi:putative addiction module component (TIGR02574 family)
MTDSELEAAALRLPPKERARLAERLLESLETLTAEESDELWAAEALRRDAELDELPGGARDNESVFAAARARLKG